MNFSNDSVLVFIQTGESGILPVSFELIGTAAALAKEKGLHLYGLSIGAPPEAASLKGLGLEKIYSYSGSRFSFFSGQQYGLAAAHCIKSLAPSIFLLGSTPEAKAFAPWTAAAVKTGITADCTELSFTSDGMLLQTRPAFSGNVMASIITTSKPQMATVRQNIMPLPKPQNELIPELIPCTLPEAPENIWLTGFEKNAGSEKSIAESPVIVAVGGGIKSKNDIPLFEDVARCLGGELASSRVLVERGWMPQSKQIGLSGSSISASLLFTFGISGSVQFISGIKNAKQIVSVNTDPQAPIFAVSSRGFICDIYEAAEKILTLSQIYS